MRFRPCIDLHDGKVKQIVGKTYCDVGGRSMLTNFVSDMPASDYASMYRRDGLAGGHVIMLGKGNETAALAALAAYPGGMQVGGGITPHNAAQYLDAGASHVIVTSYVFRDGMVAWECLDEMRNRVGPSRLVVDLSCTRRGTTYLVATDRWQKVSGTILDADLLSRMAPYCDEFLVHAIDVEGQREGVDTALVAFLADSSPLPVTYAGGVRSIEDLETIRRVGRGRVDATVGSALDIFGGVLPYRMVVEWSRRQSGVAARGRDCGENERGYS